MARAPASTDYPVEVDGVGNFMFARRTMRDELRINAEYLRLTEGVEVAGSDLNIMADWMATLKVLTVSAPEGWDVEKLDPLEPENFEKMSKVFHKLREKENSFRKGSAKASQAERKADSEGAAVLVSETVQPSAD